MANLFQPSLQPMLDGNGDIVSGGKWYFYLTGTVTPATIYADPDELVPLTNPVVADSSGVVAPIYLDPDIVYRVSRKDASGVEVGNDVDPVRGYDESAASAFALQVAADAAQTALDAIATAADRVQTGLDAASAASILGAASAALATGTVSDLVGTRIYASKALLDADLVPADGLYALVIGDATAANNDLYVKAGATTTGSWTGPLGLFVAASSVATAEADRAEVAETGAVAAQVAAELAGVGAAEWQAVDADTEYAFYYHSSTGTKTADANYMSFKSAVDETKRYRVSGQIPTGGTNRAVAVYYAADGTTVLGSEFPATATAVEAYVDQELTLPSGTSFVAVTSYITNTVDTASVPVLEVVTAGTLGRAGRVDRMIEQLYAQTSWQASTVSSSTADSFYRRVDGVVAASVNNTIEFHTLTGDELALRFTGDIRGSTAAGITYLDDADNPLGYQLPGNAANTVTSYANEALDVPKNARKIAVTVRDGLSYTIEKEFLDLSDAGTTYPITKAVILGDSITNTALMSTADPAPGTRTNVDAVSWVTYAMGELATDWENYAKASAQFTDSTNGAVELYENGRNQIDLAITNNPTATDVDCVIVALGTNDVREAYKAIPTITLGDFDTAMAKAIGSLDFTIIYDSIRYMFYSAAVQWPAAKRFAFTPIQSDNSIRTSANMLLVITAIREMAAAYGFIIIDQYGESGIVRELEDGGSGPDLSDGTHPYEDVGNTQGVLKMSRLAVARISPVVS